MTKSVNRRTNYRTVAVPLPEYALLRELAELDMRSIARELEMIIKDAHYDRFKDVRKAG